MNKNYYNLGKTHCTTKEGSGAAVGIPGNFPHDPAISICE
jgi:hypothetical protein